jgi:4-hydroxy-4-methyl-2-oxoglutarate aldolase
LAVDDLTSRLEQLDTCALSDALDRLKLPPAVTGIRAQTTVGRIAGRVLTVKLSVADPHVKSVRHLCTAVIERAGSGDIIVVEQSTGIDAAGWGGVLSNAAQIRGVSGVIVEGPARDIDEAGELGFPVYARSATARTARGRVQEIATGESIVVGGTVVSEGDYVVADSSGIVFLPAAEIAKILEAAEEIAAREKAMTKSIRAGAAVGTVMGASYENMLTTKP